MARRAEKLRARASTESRTSSRSYGRRPHASTSVWTRRLCRERRQRRPCLSAVALPVVPADAWPEVVPLARWVLERSRRSWVRARGLRRCLARPRGPRRPRHEQRQGRRGTGVGSGRNMARPEFTLSVVVPLNDEEADVRLLGDRLRAVLRGSRPMGGDSRRRRERRCDVHARRRPPRLGRALQGDPALTQLRAPGRAVCGARPGHR